MEICLPKVCLGIPNYKWNNRITYRSASLCSRKLCCWKLGKQLCFLSNAWIKWTFCSSPIPQHTARAIAPVAWKCACQSLPGLTQITTHIPIDSQTHTHATSMSKRLKKANAVFFFSWDAAFQEQKFCTNDSTTFCNCRENTLAAHHLAGTCPWHKSQHKLWWVSRARQMQATQTFSLSLTLSLPESTVSVQQKLLKAHPQWPAQGSPCW